MGREVDVQNKHIDRIGDKVSQISRERARHIIDSTKQSEKVDEGILMNRARLDRIH